MRLNNLSDNDGATKNRIRVGRGIGSGKGKTGGRGMKGQKSRSGVAIKGFEGGQMPLHMRMPKRGFTNPFRKESQIVNLGRLDEFENGTVIDPETLYTSGIVRKAGENIKILGKGELTKKLTIRAHAVSTGALEKIEKAGSTFEKI